MAKGMQLKLTHESEYDSFEFRSSQTKQTLASEPISMEFSRSLSVCRTQNQYSQ